MPFRDSANGLFLFRQFSPASCSPPLGGSDGISAVRFTPAVKYGGRENRLCNRATRCIRGHPSRAHHKLKWARTEQSVLEVLYELLPRSESSNEISTQILVVSQAPQDQPVFDRDWQQPLNHHEAQPACRVKDKRLRRAFGILDTARRLGFMTIKGLLPTPVEQG